MTSSCGGGLPKHRLIYSAAAAHPWVLQCCCPGQTQTMNESLRFVSDAFQMVIEVGFHQLDFYPFGNVGLFRNLFANDGLLEGDSTPDHNFLNLCLDRGDRWGSGRLGPHQPGEFGVQQR